MIIVRLMGGLGNQMFQYAAGRRLASVRGAPLKLDLSALKVDAPQQGDTVRTYRLGNFRIHEQIAAREEVERLLASTARRSWWWRRASAPTVIMERHFHFDPAILDARTPAYLDGYWQSERYFRDIRHLLVEEFTPREEMSLASREIADAIRADSCPVGVHIRRGDYVSNPQTNRFHGVCGPDYYRRCMQIIGERSPSPHFFVFSDDPDRALQDLRSDHPMTVVRHNGPQRDYEDLSLMSLCRYFIIANSTFSWWAAWLSESPDKIVLAPERWFAEATLDTRDLLPESWRTV